MLILSRKKDERIVIDDDIVITVVDIRGDKVRLGVEAPQSVPVHRQEVWDAIKRKEREQGQDGPATRPEAADPTGQTECQRD